MSKKETHNIVSEGQPLYGFVQKTDLEKLKEDMYRSDKEKLQLFVKMLRRNAMLNKAVITNHPAQ